LAAREAKRRGKDPEHIWNGLLWCLILGFLGARLHHIISSPADGTGGLRSYIDNPISVFELWDGGLGIVGGIAGGVIGVILYSWRHKLDPWQWLDIGALSLPLGQAIVRWANFINQELYGPPTSLPWGIRIDADHRIPRYLDLDRYPVDTTRFHPTFLYESAWFLGVFVLLLWVRRRWSCRLRDGDLFLVYLLVFGIGRAWIEQWFRSDAWRLENGLAVGSVISVALALLAGVALLVRHLHVE
jgi:phosphatidylglycerol:prolipoprotein diacylglycerol transferase